MNSCNFTGRLTRDPEMRYTGGGTPVTNFGIAVDMGKSKTGEKKTEFIEMTAFGKTAETLAKYMVKGKEIAITGKFTTDRWDDKDTGKKRSKSYIIIDQFNFIGSRGDSPRRGNEEFAGSPAAPPPQQQNDFGDDDIPF